MVSGSQLQVAKLAQMCVAVPSSAQQQPAVPSSAQQRPVATWVKARVKTWVKTRGRSKPGVGQNPG